MRDGVEIYKGKIASLKRFKDDVSEVRMGVECGIDLGNHKDIQVGDLIEAFSTEKMADELGANSAVAAAAAKLAAAATAVAAAEAAEAAAAAAAVEAETPEA